MNSLYFCTLNRPHRDFGAAVHVVEQADAQVAGEALVDELQGRHAAADDAFLPAEVVGLTPSDLSATGAASSLRR
jgi:hypothetical protein